MIGTGFSERQSIVLLIAKACASLSKECIKIAFNGLSNNPGPMRTQILRLLAAINYLEQYSRIDLIPDKREIDQAKMDIHTYLCEVGTKEGVRSEG